MAYCVAREGDTYLPGRLHIVASQVDRVLYISQAYRGCYISLRHIEGDI